MKRFMKCAFKAMYPVDNFYEHEKHYFSFLKEYLFLCNKLSAMKTNMATLQTNTHLNPLYRKIPKNNIKVEVNYPLNSHLEYSHMVKTLQRVFINRDNQI